MNKPWLSVLITTYNGEKYLPETLDSIIAQRDKGIECIVVDDGSADRTPSILEDYSKKLPMKILHQSRTGNWITNTNRALLACIGEYVCLLNQDDRWLGNRLQTMKNIIEKHPEVGFFLHPAWFIDEKGNRLGKWFCPLPKHARIIDSTLMIERLVVQNFIASAAPIFRRAMAQDLCGLDEDMWYAADWDFWLKISSRSKAIYYPEPLSEFRIHSGSQVIRHTNDIGNIRKQLETVLGRNEKYLGCSKLKKKIMQVARFSIEVNIILSSMFHHKKTIFFKLIYQFLSLGPQGWYKYIRDSRIWERAFVRFKLLPR